MALRRWKCVASLQVRAHGVLGCIYLVLCSLLALIHCSAFAAHAWRVGLGSALPPYNATEQVPRDNFMMAIFNGSYWHEDNCPGGVLKPDGGSHGTLCQVTGQYEMPFSGYNSIMPCECNTTASGSRLTVFRSLVLTSTTLLLPLSDASMNSHCGSQWPSYTRCLDGDSMCQC